MKISIEANKFLQAVIALEAERSVGESWLEERRGDRRIPLPPPLPGAVPPVELSILLPVWNPEPGQFLRCLRSIGKAQLADISHEILISDNASDSDVVQRCVAEAGLANVRYHRQTANIGGFPNFNFCLANARGEWLHLLSHDDWIDPGFYQALLRGTAASSGTDLRYCRCRLYEEETKSTRLMFDEAPEPGVLQDFLDRQAPCQRIQLVSAIVSKRAVDEAGGFDAFLGAGADWEYWTRVASRHSVFFHPGELATYVLHQASWSQREGNFESADSFRKFRRILLRILLSVPEGKRLGAANGFMVNMVQRLLSVALRNKRMGRLPANRPLVEALLPAARDAGLLPEIEVLLATLN